MDLNDKDLNMIFVDGEHENLELTIVSVKDVDKVEVPTVKILYRVIGGPDENMFGQHITARYQVDGEHRWRIRKLAVACGLCTDVLLPDGKTTTKCVDNFTPKMLEKKSIMADTRMSESKGQYYCNITKERALTESNMRKRPEQSSSYEDEFIEDDFDKLANDIPADNFG